MGTHGDEGTKLDSPLARSKPATVRPKPPPVPARNDDDPEDRVGSQLGSYRVAEVLGKGGMGYVYRAEHVKLGREVALKLLRADYARRRDAVARFIQEARTVNRIRHRNIVDVPDIVELDDGTTFIVMEFLRGTSLGKWARTGIDLPRALAVLVQICDGLAAAHAVGVVHRDLKPDNVMVLPTSDGAELVKLLDFGVAKLLNRDDHDDDMGFQTAAGSVIGTPAYMSPEQAGGMAIDARSDTYSLGAIMYELFCGQPMFRGRSFGEYVRKHLTERPTLPSQTAGGAGLDPRLEAIIMKALEKEPAMRYGQIGELRDALLGLLGGMETHPPGFAALTGTGLRPMATANISHLSAVLVPSAPQIPRMPTPNVAHSSIIQPSGMHGALPQTGVQPATPPTPLWVWFVGGAIAVGLGVAGAMWFARGSASDLPADLAIPAAPSASPIVEDKPPAKLVTLRFDSLPSAGVYEAGHAAELCRTPCAFDVDPGTDTKRTYVVRATGYKDGSLAVDLSGPQHDLHITLDQLAPPPIVDPTPAEIVDDRPVVKRPGGKVAKKPVGKKPVEVIKKPDEPPPPEDKPPDKPPEPVKKPPVDDKVPDASETLDPFKHKRP